MFSLNVKKKQKMFCFTVKTSHGFESYIVFLNQNFDQVIDKNIQE